MPAAGRRPRAALDQLDAGASVVAVKPTFANNVSAGYKNVDAVQLVGE